MVHASYSYKISSDKKLVMITDNDTGQMSVTNDIENVIAEICEINDLDADSKVWIYKDSQGIIDGYNPTGDCFYHIGVRDFSTAISSNIVKARLKFAV